MKTVYIIAPYTKGEVELNVRRTMLVFDKLASMGYAPFNPLLFHFQNFYHPRNYEDWMKIDSEWLIKADIVVRIKGESNGGDREEKLTHSIRIPFFQFTFEEIRDTNCLEILKDVN